MSGTCKGCGHVSTDSPQDSPPNPEHCGNCPPWICDDCHETCSAEDLCSCWTPIESVNFADLKGIFAASDMSLDKRDLGDAS